MTDRGSGFSALLLLNALFLTAAPHAFSAKTTTHGQSNSTAPASEKTHGLNILFIETQAQAPGFAGFEGNKLAKTPNLDRLAAQSVRFTRAYVPTPQDGPSRAAILTGRYPHMNGVTADDTPLPKRPDTFTMRLKNAGYACGLVGGWDLKTEESSQPGLGLTDYVALSDPPQNDPDWLDAQVHVNGSTSKAGKYLDDWHGDRAIEALDKFRNRPFFLWVSLRGPSEPFVYPPGLEKSFPVETSDLPKTRTQDPHAWPPKLIHAPAAERFKHILEDPQLKEPYLREARSKYLAMIARADESVGRILRHLDELKLTDRTAIVFTSAHGFALGDHALFGTGPAFYDELIRVPLLIQVPRASRAGMKIENIVSLVDLCPTFCGLAGLDLPYRIKARSLLSFVDGPRPSDWANEAFVEFEHEAPPPRVAPTMPPPVQNAPRPNPSMLTPPTSAGAPGPHIPGTGVATTRPAGAPFQHAPAAIPSSTSPPPAPVVPVPAAPPVETAVRGLIALNFKFLDYIMDQGLLYDLQRDPDEMHNVLSDLHYTAVRKILADRLKLWRKETRDPRPPQ